MQPRSRVFAGFGLAGLALLSASCGRHDAEGSSPGATAGAPPSATAAASSSDVGASGVQAPYVAVLPADAQPAASAASGNTSSGSQSGRPGDGR